MVSGPWNRNVGFLGVILQTMVSGISLVLGLRTRMEDPSVYVFFWPEIVGGFGLSARGVRLL